MLSYTVPTTGLPVIVGILASFVREASELYTPTALPVESQMTICGSALLAGASSIPFGKMSSTVIFSVTGQLLLPKQASADCDVVVEFSGVIRIVAFEARAAEQTCVLLPRAHPLGRIRVVDQINIICNHLVTKLPQVLARVVRVLFLYVSLSKTL